MDIEEEPTGYPGFQVAQPPHLRLVAATLSRIALAKISDIAVFSASFNEESFLFSPWLTALVEYEHKKVFIGAYRTDEPEPEVASPDAARTPTFCLRQSVWDREKDLQRVSDMASLQEYVTSGPQTDDTFIFGNRVTHPPLDEVMNTAIAVLAKGISVEPTDRRDTDWDKVTVELADDRLTCRVEYSPILAHSESLETALPSWMEAISRLIQDPGLKPDGEITISIKRSVPEMVNAQPFAKHLKHTDLRY